MEEIKAVLIELDAAYNKVEELKNKVNELSLARVKELSGLEIGDKVEVKDLKYDDNSRTGLGIVKRLIIPINNSQSTVRSLVRGEFKYLPALWKEYKLEVNKIKKDGTMGENGLYYKGYEYSSTNFKFTKV